MYTFIRFVDDRWSCHDEISRWSIPVRQQGIFFRNNSIGEMNSCAMSHFRYKWFLYHQHCFVLMANVKAVRPSAWCVVLISAHLTRSDEKRSIGSGAEASNKKQHWERQHIHFCRQQIQPPVISGFPTPNQSKDFYNTFGSSNTFNDDCICDCGISQTSVVGTTLRF